ncbi:helix-turn-helix domain-containing protein [Actinoallomurus sp. CA-150999]|uniref:helix-turn-helix domain-containing protein n=1 Tax=Actinoallomurus sp. CA-150999 TaxID=3239887 RepID=UPI003D8A5545
MRTHAGNPDYRSMARRVGCAPSTLSTASSGRKLPTLAATLAYVRACGADEAEQEEWTRRWEAINTALSPERSVEASSAVRHDAPAEDGAAPPEGGQRRVRRLAWAVGVGSVLLATIGAVSFGPGRSTKAHAVPGSRVTSRSAAAAGRDAPVPVRRHDTLVMIPGRVADLDSESAGWDEQPDPGPSGANIWFDAHDHALHGVDDNDIAVLPAGNGGGFWPCALEQNYGVTVAAPDIRPGRILCGITAANRVAQLRVTGVQHDPSGLPNRVTFDVTVWVPLHKT